MANRKLYSLEKCIDAVIIYRTDNNYGRQGVVFRNGQMRREYTPYAMPGYIIKECHSIMNADSFELERGYTYGGKPCKVDFVRSSV